MDTETETNFKKIDEYYQKFGQYNIKRKARFKKYFKYYHRLEVIGAENIPDGPAIIALNHGGGFDLDIVAISDHVHPTRPIQVLIVESWHFLKSNWGRYWVGSGIPLWTRGGIRWEYIDPYLDKNGKHFPSLTAIFPEGHSGLFRRRHVLHKFYPGVVRIALKYKVPIVPVGMIGFHNVSPIFAEIQRDHAPNDPILLPFTFPFKLKVEVGKPFEIGEYYGRDLSKPEEWWVANEIVRPKVADILSKHSKVVLGDVDAEMKKPQV